MEQGELAEVLVWGGYFLLGFVVGVTSKLEEELRKTEPPKKTRTDLAVEAVLSCVGLGSFAGFAMLVGAWLHRGFSPY